MGRFKRTDSKKFQSIFYVYIIVDVKNNRPLYVGKGHNDRVLQSNGRFKKETIYKYPFSQLVEKEAFELEKDLILTIGRKDLGTGPLLNKTNGGQGLSGFIFSEESKAKISTSMKKVNGGKKSEEHKKKIGLALKGRTFSEEWRKKLSLAKKGKPSNAKGYSRCFSEEHRKKLSLAKKGKKLSQEHRKKLSKAAKRKILSPSFTFKNRNHTNEAKKRIREANKGKKLSRETKKKISTTLKMRNLNGVTV